VTRLRRALLGAALAAFALTSCAPPPAPGELTSFSARYRVERAKREQRMAAAEAELVVRVEGRATGRLPGLMVTAAMAAPDRVRLRAGWMLGTALDLLAERDSVRVWLPTEHALLEVGGLAELLHQRAPVALLLTALAASWDPPADAWRQGVVESTQVWLGWREGADSLSLVVDGATRPVGLRIERAGRVLEVRYSGWRRVEGVDWPARVEIADTQGWLRMRTELQSLRSAERLHEDWFELRAPADAERLDWQQVRERLGARGEGTP